MAKVATIEDVARLAGVSRQTVSNAVNSPDKVKAETKKRVDEAIVQLGYRPNLGARRLRTKQSSTIGIRLDPYAGGISGAVLDRFVHALTEQANEKNRRVLVYVADDPQDELEQLGNLFDSGEIDSVVLTGTFPGDIRPAWLQNWGRQFVTFGRPWGSEDFSQPLHKWVDVNGMSGTAQATRHAVNTYGTNIAFLGWPKGSATGDERERGWREALVELGLPFGERLSVSDSTSEARNLVVSALADGTLQADALVCASDTLAVGASLAIMDQGGTGRGVYGFDNTPTAQALGLPSVEQQPEEVAKGVLSLLLDNPTARDYVLIDPILVLR